MINVTTKTSLSKVATTTVTKRMVVIMRARVKSAATKAAKGLAITETIITLGARI